MLSCLEMEFEGRPHSGLDDAKNIARIVGCMIGDRAFLRLNQRLIHVNTDTQDKSIIFMSRQVFLKNVETIDGKTARTLQSRSHQLLDLNPLPLV